VSDDSTQEIQKHILKTQHSESNLDYTIEEKKVEHKREMRVMVIGRLENPKVVCMRELYHEIGETTVIPLSVRTKQA